MSKWIVPLCVLFSCITAARAQVPGSPYLKDLAAAHNVAMGVAVKGASLLSDATYANFIRSHFGAIKPEYEMKANTIRTDSGGWNYGPADTVAAFAKNNGLKLRGHTLVWYKHGPRWLTTLNATTVEAAMNDHITGVVNRYKRYGNASYDVTAVWDVVNEALRDSQNTGWPGTWWEQWLRRVGDGNPWSHVPDYIGKAFIRTRALHPTGTLIYNDYGIELDDPANANEKSDAAYALMQDLLSRNIPIDGIGFQCHFTTTNPPNLTRFSNNLKRFADLGLKIYITELDVRVPTGQDTAAERSKQADVYWGVVHAALMQPACTAVEFWGFTDKYVSTESFYLNRYPMMLDSSFNAKPAYWAVRDLLRDGGFVGTRRIMNRQSGKVIHVDGGSLADYALLVQYTWSGWGSQKWRFELAGDRSYRIVNVQSGKLMHVRDGSTSAGARLDQHPSLGRWKVDYAGDGHYRLIAYHSGLAAHVLNGSTANSAPLDQYGSTAPSAQWQILTVE